MQGWFELSYSSTRPIGTILLVPIYTHRKTNQCIDWCMCDSAGIGGDMPSFSLLVLGFFWLTCYVTNKTTNKSCSWRQIGTLTSAALQICTFHRLTFFFFSFFQLSQDIFLWLFCCSRLLLWIETFFCYFFCPNLSQLGRGAGYTLDSSLVCRRANTKTNYTRSHLLPLSI